MMIIVRPKWNRNQYFKFTASDLPEHIDEYDIVGYADTEAGARFVVWEDRKLQSKIQA